MADARQPMQAAGRGQHVGENFEPGATGAGESGGGAYPNPHTGKKSRHDLIDHGGQTEISEKAPGDD